MRPLQYKSRSDSCDESNDGYGYIEEHNQGGWDANVGIDDIFKNKNVISALIQLANNKFTLKTVFSNLKIGWTVTPSSSGWTHKTRCPFPDQSQPASPRS